MKKKVTHKQAYKAMKKIIRYCEQTTGMCDETCIFYDEDHPTNTCILSTDENPLAWARKYRKAMIKYNLAEVLKCES